MTREGKAPVRIGFVGCGNVFGAYLSAAQRLEARGEAQVVAACGRAHQRRLVEQAARGLRFSTDHEDLVGDPAIDLVVILTPMATHAAIARAALAAGKHVLMEKPVATELDEAAALVALARRSGKHLLAAPFTPLSPTFRAMRARVHGGEIGVVTAARGRYGWAGPDWAPWFYQRGGGALFDLAVYDVTSLTALLGPVRRVTALTGIARPERAIGGGRVAVEVEDNAHLVLEHEGGCLSQVSCGFVMQQYRSPGLELYGTAGTVQMLGDDWDPDGYELWRSDVGHWRVFKETDPEWPWTDGLRALVEAIRAGGPPPLPPEHAVHVLEVLLAARASGREGARQEVASRFPALELPPPPSGDPVHLVHDRGRRATP